MLDAYKFTSRNGIVEDKDYPKYHGKQSKCSSSNDQEKFYNTDMKEEDMISNERIKTLL